MIGVAIAALVIAIVAGCVVALLLGRAALAAMRRWWQWRQVRLAHERQRIRLQESRRNGHNRSGRVTRS